MLDKITLYKIVNEIKELFDEIEDNDGLLPEEDEIALKKLESLLKTKTDSVADFRRSQLDKLKATNSRINDLKKRADKIENSIDKFDNYIKFCLHRTDNEKFEGNLNTICLGRRSKSVFIQKGFEKFEGNDRYMNFNVKATPDKSLIKEALKEGIEVKGAKIVENRSIAFK